ncbi:hypothetical protein [Rhizobium sp. 007]|uniref:hypothetical protein n=1 Tax=Rhizobium sp. 007 TaxID=2785056 RepID=UPI00188DF633|nr:hypothetical protein [Rhizobium sp. 007]QPB21162.1 hypothetical protein ISN39_06800 [Rhizobium sp. 007]
MSEQKRPVTRAKFFCSGKEGNTVFLPPSIPRISNPRMTAGEIDRDPRSEWYGKPNLYVGCQGAVEGLTNRLVEDGVLPGLECRGRGTGASEQELAAAASSQSATSPRQVG